MDKAGQAFWEKLIAVLADAVDDVLRQFADKTEDRLRVEYPPASKPGEAPHRRTGALQEGIGIEGFSVTNDSISGTIVSRREGTQEVPYYLEEILNRPYISTTYLEMLDGGAARELAEATRAKLR